MSTIPQAFDETVGVPDRAFFTADQLLTCGGWDEASLKRLVDWMCQRRRPPVEYLGAVWLYRTLVTEFVASQLRRPIRFIAELVSEGETESVGEEDGGDRRTITVRMHPALHRFLKELANEKRVSLNELCVDLLSRPVSEGRP